MQELVGRLENAAGPDRELDCDIHIAVTKKGRKEFAPGIDCLHPYVTVRGAEVEVPRYTASADAALSLANGLPDDFGVGLFRSSYQLDIPDTGPRWAAEVWNIRDRVAKDYRENLGQMKIYSGKHVNAAIAVCIAIFKAQQAKQPESVAA